MLIKDWLKEYLSQKYQNTSFDVLDTPDKKMGDYSINLVFSLAKKELVSPLDIGARVCGELIEDPEIKNRFDKVEFVKPGFINFYIGRNILRESILKILKGESEAIDTVSGKINLEFVSANPTGPLTVGNARAASFGDTLGNILKKCGADVSKEYYINDMGVQVKKLGESFYKKYLKNFKNQEVEFGEDLYQGQYVDDYVKKIVEDLGEDVAEGLSEDSWKNEAIETLINASRNSMKNLGVSFDTWFYESDLHSSGEINKSLLLIESNGKSFEKDGARWLKIDEENSAVIIKSDGTTSYLMNDIAYTKNKFERGFDRLINIWGADHHGDVPRLLAGTKAIGHNPEKIKIILHQLVFIKKGDQRQRMSKRKGEFILLDELLSEVGKDAIRFFFLLKDMNTHMEFDIDLAKEQSSKNPVFYIQYAFARINSIFKKTAFDLKKGDDLNLETESLNEDELDLIKEILIFNQKLADISRDLNVHHLAQYSLSLAGSFHKFYERNRVLDEDKIDFNRLAIVLATYVTLKECLDLMGLSAPESM